MLLHDFLGLYGIDTILKMILTAYSGLTSVQLNEASGFGQRIASFAHPTKQSKAKFS
jgi:glycerol uptake facilitator-like aquaporin